MEQSLIKRDLRRKRRMLRIRKDVRGTSEKPRLSVCRTNKHISAQLIDDENHSTLIHVGTMSVDMKKGPLGKKSKEAAKELGKKLAQLAKEKNIEKAVFDRGWYRFHGLIAELANAAREQGLKF